MAAELVGGALLSSFLPVVFDRLASRDILDYFQKRKLNETLVEKLKIMLLSIHTVIDDAEEKQFSDPNVKAWFDKVKDAVYEAEDVLDEIDYEVYKRKLEDEIQTSVTSKVRNFFNASISSLDREIESRMKQVLEDLEFLESRKIVLGLKQGSGGSVGSIRKLPTTSLVDEAEICGRDDDKEIIIKWLLNDTRFYVISIVGMGGLGKTTLAQLVYNDQRVKDNFDLKVWICVSDDFDVLRVTRTILESITLSNDDTKDLNILQIKLKKMLTGKKFLIVFDDVWNEDHILWESFQAPFIYGATGSRILVTTRNDMVALATHSNKIYHLKQLSNKDGWLLFTKYAFRDEHPQANLGLEEIGRKMVEKCKGLPLAVKTIGSLLYTKISYEEWSSILTSEIWNVSNNHNNILPALRLSYHHLPPHLKRCFAYCSLFPKDYEFDKEELVQLWMAQDFLHDSQLLNMAIEQVGNQYFQDLLSRSFIQKSSKNKMKFVMHDLLNDLANFVSGEFCLRLEDKGVSQISEKTRHLSFLTFQYLEVKRFEVLHKTNKLQTFLPFSAVNYFWTSSNMIPNQLSKCKCLRVLSLSYYYNTMELPDSIGKLKHLRYLDLSNSGVKKLPDSTCLLYNLQTLKLANCRNLDELPSGLHKLHNLRHLDLRKTKLKKVPQQLGKLKDLQVLTSFYVGKCSDCNIKQLAELNLQGKLSILELQNVVHGMDALAANLKEKKYLEELSLNWSKNNNESWNEREVLEKLQPHQNLKKLSIKHYGGTWFPNWLASCTLSNVVSLKLKNCKYCLFLPSLGLLTSLKSLLIKGLEGIVAIGAEFFGNNSSTISFASLEILKFEEMPNWEEWECKTASRAFPCLKELHINKCPNLKEYLPVQLPSLEILNILDCQQLVASVPWSLVIHTLALRNCGNVQLEYVPSTLKALQFDGPCMDAILLEKIEHTIANTCIEELEIQNCPNLEFPLCHCHYSLLTLRIDGSCVSLRTFPLDFFPKLQQLDLSGCSNLEMISISEEHKHDPTSLMTIKIWRCPKFVSFPKGGFSAPRLESCSVAHLESLKSLPEQMNILFPTLCYLRIIDCPQVEPFPEGGLPSNLRHLTIYKCPKLFASRTEWGLNNYSSLDDLFIAHANMVESLSELGLLPPNLTCLCIQGFSNLTTLDYEGLCHFSLLQILALEDCPRLQYLPKEGLPNSLSYFAIRGNCPLLKQRCQKLKGEDWGKIAHIPCIMIDYEVIS